MSDLHWRSETAAWLVKEGAEVGAEGLLGRVREGNGVAVFCQIDPERLEADSKTYFRLTRWHRRGRWRDSRELGGQLQGR